MKRLLLLLALALPVPVFSQAVLEAVDSGSCGSVATSCDLSFTVPAGTELLLACQFIDRTTQGGGESATWNTSETMTAIGVSDGSASGDAGLVKMYRLANPTATTANITTTHPGTHRAGIAAIALSGVDLTVNGTGIRDSDAHESPTDGAQAQSYSNTLTSASGDFGFLCLSANDFGDEITGFDPESGETERFDSLLGGAASAARFASYTEASSGATLALGATWTVGSNTSWAAVSADVAAEAAGAPAAAFRMLMGAN